MGEYVMPNTQTTHSTTTPAITGQTREEQQKILQLAMQYLNDPWITLKNPHYLYSQVGEPKPNRSFLRMPEQCWNLFFKVDVPIYMFNSDRVSPEAQAAAGNMTTAGLVIGVEIGRREGVYSVERHFLSVDSKDVFDTQEPSSGISDWHSSK
jgi:hypothetical protein